MSNLPFGQKGAELLKELKRSDWLPAYNDDGVRSVLQETSFHLTALKQEVVPDVTQRRKEDVPSALLHDRIIRRNKRCLLAYHNYRLEKLRNLRWETTGILPPSVQMVLNESEQEFFSQYDQLVSQHSSNMDLDLSSSLQPPNEEYVQVRVVKEGLGRITTEFGGSVEFTIGTIHFLRRLDVEHLIRQGVLEELKGEEGL